MPVRDRDDVALCCDCLESLLGRVGVSSTPTLPVLDMAASIAFYERAGFGVRRYGDDGDGDGFAFVDFDGQSVFDLDAVVGMDPTTNHAGCYLITDDADWWHARMLDAGLPVTPLADRAMGHARVHPDRPLCESRAHRTRHPGQLSPTPRRRSPRSVHRSSRYVASGWHADPSIWRVARRVLERCPRGQRGFMLGASGRLEGPEAHRIAPGRLRCVPRSPNRPRGLVRSVRRQRHRRVISRRGSGRRWLRRGCRPWRGWLRPAR